VGRPRRQVRSRHQQHVLDVPFVRALWLQALGWSWLAVWGRLQLHLLDGVVLRARYVQELGGARRQVRRGDEQPMLDVAFLRAFRLQALGGPRRAVWRRLQQHLLVRAAVRAWNMQGVERVGVLALLPGRVGESGAGVGRGSVMSGWAVPRAKGITRRTKGLRYRKLSLYFMLFMVGGEGRATPKPYLHLCAELCSVLR